MLGVRPVCTAKRERARAVVGPVNSVISSLVTPVLIQLVFDNGFDPEFRPEYVLTVCAVALGLGVLTFVAARAAARRLVRAAEEAGRRLPQRDDDGCQAFTIDQSGMRGASDSGGAEGAEITSRCWR